MTTGPRDDADIERTDELPVLSEEAAVDFRYRDANFDEDPLSVTGEHDTTAIHKLTVGIADAARHRVETESRPPPDIERLERDIESLSARWRDVESLLASNSTALADLQVELSDSRRELRESHERQQSLLGELTERNAERDELHRQLAAAEGSTRMAGAELERARARISELESALTSAQAQAAELQSDLAQAHDRIAALDSALEDTLAAQSRLESERDELSRKLNEAVTAHEAALTAASAARPEEPGPADSDGAASAGVPGAGEPTGGDRAVDAGSTSAMLEKIAGLESYIAGRKDRWQEMEATVVERDKRIEELEQELVYRVNQQALLEEQIATEQAIATELRAKLDETQRALERSAVSGPASPADEASGPEETPDATLTGLERRIDDAKSRISDLEGALDASAGETEPAPPALLCLTDEAAPRHDITRDELTIGRGSECDIRIPTHFVSRMHAVIQRRGNEIAIADRGSTNGVFVNSVRVDHAVLHDGDWVTIGETQFRFVADGAAGQ